MLELHVQQRKFGNQSEYDLLSEIKKIWGIKNPYKKIKEDSETILFHSFFEGNYIKCQKYYKDFNIEEYFNQINRAYEAGVHIPPLIKSLDQKLYKNFELKDSKWRCFIYKHLPGKHIEDDYRHLYKIGIEMAKMHEFFVHGDLHKNNIIINNDEIYFIDIFNGENSDKRKDVKAIKESFPERFKEIERGYDVHCGRHTRMF